MPEVVMPRLSDSMEEGTILRWLKADGETVHRGEDIAEIETDKAAMTYAADSDGTLAIVAAEGDTLAIGQVIARIGEPGGVGAAANGARRGRVRASPLARRVARERGVDLHAITGSGPGGRVVKADVEGARTEAPEAPPSAPAPEPAGAAEPEPEPATATVTPTAKGEVTVQELTRSQQVIARRMAESRATIPDFTVQTDVDMGRCVAARAALAALADPAPSVNDLVVKACAIALREMPRVNGAYRDGRFELHARVNVGIAVAGPDTLVVPTLFDADRKGLATLARERRALTERAQAGVITPPELAGATFTVSNLGPFGVTRFTAVINPPQAAILAVGAVVEQPVVRAGAVVAGHVMGLTLACDHRILLGADGARFLARVRALLEEPAALAL